MTTGLRVDVGLWLIAAIATAVAAGASRSPTIAPSARPALGTAAVVSPRDPDSLGAAAEHVTETDPFRLDRRPASRGYQATSDGVATSAPPPSRPALVLKGIIGTGRPTAWIALLDGVPGHGETTVVHDGDTIGGLRVRHVGPDTVVVAARDTSWRLTVRREWH